MNAETNRDRNRKRYKNPLEQINEFLVRNKSAEDREWEDRKLKLLRIKLFGSAPD